MAGPELQTVQLAQDFDPSDRPLQVGVIVDASQRAERQFGLRAGKIVEFSPDGPGQHPDGVAAIEGEDLGTRIPEPLCSNQPECR